MGKLEALTVEQEAQLDGIRDEWIGHGLSCEPADRPTAEQAVRDLYRAEQLDEPHIVWAESPWQGVRMAAAVQATDMTASAEQVNEAAADYESATTDQLREAWGMRAWGQHDAGLYAWWDTWTRFGIDGLPAEQIDAHLRIGRSAGWWYPMEGAVVMCERTAELHFDDDPLPRLHSETGKACVYPDGWGFHSWHGFTVPEWVIVEPTIERIGQETNIEVRRCAIESLGWDHFVGECTPVGDPIDDPGNPGQSLQLFDAPASLWGEQQRIVLCVNGTPERDGTRRQYGLLVDNNETHPGEAVAASYGVEWEIYQQMERRT